MSELFYKYYDYLIDNGIATEEEINLVCEIKGRSEETLELILDCRTGYQSFDQLDDFCEEEDEEDEEELEDDTDSKLEETIAMYDIAGING
jgi:hypothetical protein